MPGMIVWYGRFPGPIQFGCPSCKTKLRPLFWSEKPQPSGTSPEPNASKFEQMNEQALPAASTQHRYVVSVPRFSSAADTARASERWASALAGAPSPMSARPFAKAIRSASTWRRTSSGRPLDGGSCSNVASAISATRPDPFGGSSWTVFPPVRGRAVNPHAIAVKLEEGHRTRTERRRQRLDPL